MRGRWCRRWCNWAAWRFLVRAWFAVARRWVACHVGVPALSVHVAGVAGFGFWGVRISPVTYFGNGRAVWRLQVSGPFLLVGLAWLPAWFGREEKRAGLSPAPLVRFGVLR